jgi:hypothetical protein
VPTIDTRHEVISFGDISGLPDIDSCFTACRTGPDCHGFDVVDFGSKTINRWRVPLFDMPGAVATLQSRIDSNDLPLGCKSHQEYYRDHFMTPHVAQLSPQGFMFISFGILENGFCIVAIDTNTGTAHLLPDSFESDQMLYTSTGGFDSDYNHWMFARWRLDDALDVLEGKSNNGGFEIGQINIADLSIEGLYQADIHMEKPPSFGALPTGLHQVTGTSDGRYAVTAPFKCHLNVPYPKATPEEDPQGYRRSHEAGIRLEDMVTIDLKGRTHWTRQVPAPVPAHLEFDPKDPHAFYVSAHNICPDEGGMMLEGPAVLYKMRIVDGDTVIEGSYTDEQFLRITQHTVFSHRDKTMLAVTCFPNKLDFLDAKTMEMCRRVEIFPSPPMEFDETGNVLSPNSARACFSINPSRDGKFIILESAEEFLVYDYEDNRFLDVTVPRHLPDGWTGRGHTRIAGQ